MTIFLVSGASNSGKGLMAASLPGTTIDLTTARLTHPITYPQDLVKALELSLKNTHHTTVNGITAVEEIAHIKQAFPKQQLVHFHMLAGISSSMAESKLANECDFLVTSRTLALETVKALFS